MLGVARGRLLRGAHGGPFGGSGRLEGSCGGDTGRAAVGMVTGEGRK